MPVGHRDATLAVIQREGARAYLVEDAAFAARDRPELAIETDCLEEIWADNAQRRPDLMHPNCPRPTRRPWGATEFACLDSTSVCVVFRRW